MKILSQTHTHRGNIVDRLIVQCQSKKKNVCHKVSSLAVKVKKVKCIFRSIKIQTNKQTNRKCSSFFFYRTIVKKKIFII